MMGRIGAEGRRKCGQRRRDSPAGRCDGHTSQQNLDNAEREGRIRVGSSSENERSFARSEWVAKCVGTNDRSSPDPSSKRTTLHNASFYKSLG